MNAPAHKWTAKNTVPADTRIRMTVKVDIEGLGIVDGNVCGYFAGGVKVAIFHKGGSHTYASAAFAA